MSTASGNLASPTRDMGIPPTVIRPAEHADIPNLIRMGQEFAASDDYRGKVRIDPDYVTVFVTRLIENPEGCVLVAQLGSELIGMMGLLIVPHPFSGDWVAAELFWWVKPEARGGSAGYRMLKQAQGWATERGAKRLVMVAPNKRLERFYRRLGYDRLESSWQIDL